MNAAKSVFPPIRTDAVWEGSKGGLMQFTKFGEPREANISKV